MQRKLAAILSADVHGYSRLMGEDEPQTVRTLTDYREVLGSLIREHGGRVVDAPGDNLLAEFPSAVDGLRCADAIQRALESRNAALPEGRRMQFRIGLNIGDVIVDGERIYGDGVNIAARVQDLSQPGGICISGTIYDQVEGKLPFEYEYLGERTVKNIARPVRAYRVAAACQPGPAGNARERGVPPASPSIAVLPFDNMSSDPDQGYFSDGITEDLITDLSKLSGLFVIARHSSFTYKGRPVKVQQVGSELGVRYVLEGSVRKAGERVRITAQLIDAVTGHHLWADRYDRRLDDVFAVQDEITHSIVDVLAVMLSSTEQQRSQRRTEKPDAYDLVLRGVDQLRRATHASNGHARALFEQAIGLDADYAEAYALLAETYFRDWSMGWSRRGEPLERALELAERAAAMDDLLPRAHRTLAVVLLWSKQHERAAAEAGRAVALAPNDADSHRVRGEVLSWSRPDEAIAPVRKAMQLNPRYPASYSYTLGHIYLLIHRHEDALRELRLAAGRNPDWFPAHAFLAATYAELGRLEEANAERLEMDRLSPGISIDEVADRLPYEDLAVLARMLAAFRAAGIAGP
jgi:adenylate cyclase